MDGVKLACEPLTRGRREAAIVDALGSKSIVLVGMMGAGKTVVGRRLAARLGLDFVDSDHEIEAAARMNIPEIFERHGEPYFRDRECKIVGRLVSEGQRVVATGGGAFIHPPTRSALMSGTVSIWLKAEFDILMRRVRKRQNRPLLQTADPEGTMRRLIDERYPIYAQADITVISRDGPHDAVVEDIFAAIERRSSAL
ncbi:shikimate kinase [Lichenihabitans psoromatis]|uniref:shikimate kinase n=1 Tax=Lichenihabitans psoromatis TaxID=2528642 RepID=UPI0010383DCA|nr:shikimate kinase [Lichenihabitans psoromatis]